MNYVYDIVLNLNEKLYNFYDWNKEDKIELFIKIPIIKVDQDTIRELINSKTIVSKELLNKIYRKNDLFSTNKVLHKEYISIFSSNDISVAIEFDKTGLSIKKSYISIDEETDILEYIKHLKYSIVDYKVVEKKQDKNLYKTRYELEERIMIIDYLKSIYENKNIDKLNYLFYEVYGEKYSSYNKEYIKLINTVENNGSNYEKLKEIIKLFNYNVFAKKSSLNT